MSSVTIVPGTLAGTLDLAKLAPSKSFLHREIIAAYLAGAPMPYFDSQDIQATYNAMQNFSTATDIFVGESASTLRFLIPLSILYGGKTFITKGRLAQRPLDAYTCMKTAHITCNGNNITTSGNLTGGEFSLRGDSSSQFVTGLLFALPLLNTDSNIHLTTPLESAAYVDMTLETLKRFGIHVEKQNNNFHVPGRQRYIAATQHELEADFSYAAFFIVANALGAKIELLGLPEKTVSGDSAIFSILNQTEIDISQTPDLFPALCILACGKHTTTHIYNAKRLRLKESDRLHAMAQELGKLGADICEGATDITIHGHGTLHGGQVYSHGDHRIAMALTIAALCICTAPVVIDGTDCVKKSAPHFFEHIKTLQKNNISY